MFRGIAIAIPELVVFSGASPQLLREFQLRASIQMQEFRPADALQRNGETWIQPKRSSAELGVPPSAPCLPDTKSATTPDGGAERGGPPAVAGRIHTGEIFSQKSARFDFTLL